MTAALGRRGTVALEFAIVGTAFFTLLLGAFQIAFLAYAQISLDHAAAISARSMQVGTNRASAVDPETFRTAAFCPALSGLLDCSRVTIVLTPASDYQYPPTGPGLYDTGSVGSQMLLKATYLTSLPSWPVDVSFLVGVAAYQNE